MLSKYISMDIYFILQIVFGLVLTIVVILISLIIKSGHFPTLHRFRAIQKLPGPKGYWFVGNAIELANVPVPNLLVWLSEKFKVYDRMMRLWLLVVSNVYIIDPEDIQIVFNSVQYIQKGLDYTLLRPWLDEGLLTNNGDKWHSRRKLLTPAFHFKILEDNMNHFNKNSAVLLKKLKESQGQAINVASFMKLCTLDVIMGAAMGLDLDSQNEGSAEYVKQLNSVTQLLMERIMRPQLFLDWTFNISSTGRKFYKGVKYLHEFSYKVIRERRKDSTSLLSSNNSRKKHNAFLDKLLAFEKQNPGLFNDKDIREEVDTFMFEGHDTTSSALVFIFFNLGTYPEIQAKVCEELNDIFGSDTRDFTLNDLNKMIYLEQVIKESLRLYPSVPVVTRLLEKDLVLSDGTLIPTHTNLIVPIYQVHRNIKYWEEPEKFDPERFSKEQSLKRHPYAYIPFSAGARNCIGQRFAMMELKTVVSSVLRHFQVESITRKEDFNITLHLVLHSSKPIMCKFIPRQN